MTFRSCSTHMPTSLSVILLITLCLSPVVANEKCPSVRHSKVLILGAGMSGISAAKTFHDHGVDDFVILEGYDRVGGRMRKTEFAGTTIELGANWVQGLKNNPIWTLAQKYGLKGNYTMGDPIPGRYIIRNETGHNVTKLDGHEALAHASDSLHKIVEERQKSGMNDLDVRTGLRLAGWQPDNPVQSVVEYFYYDFDAGERPHFISCKVKMFTNGSIQSQDGQQFFICDPKGYAYIVEEMAHSFLRPGDTRLCLNQVVETIKWNNFGVEISVKTGETYTADYLLVTFSIGVLKSRSVTFAPSLPAKTLESIFKIEMANYIKIFLKFPKTFWDKKEYIFYASGRRGYYPMWQDFEINGGLPSGSVNILIVTVTGEEATRVQYQSDEETKNEIMAVLRNVYGKDIPNPIDFYYPRWAFDPLFYGCYSNNPIGMSHDDFLVLQSNVSKIYFAGEATNELYNGFVHGAYYSGLNRAEKMIKDIKKNDNQD